MKIERFEIEKDNPCQVQGPSLRVILDDCGCGEPHCGCSPENFIMLSDGEVGLTVALTDEQVQAIKNGSLHLTEKA